MNRRESKNNCLCGCVYTYIYLVYLDQNNMLFKIKAFFCNIKIYIYEEEDEEVWYLRTNTNRKLSTTGSLGNSIYILPDQYWGLLDINLS